MPKPRALVVEDEFLVRLTLVEALGDDGFDVTEAGSADEGLEVLQAADGFALLVTDIQLPGVLSGLQLADAARRIHPELPIIFMTGRPDSLAGRVASARDAYVAKPCLPSEISAAARRLIVPPSD